MIGRALESATSRVVRALPARITLNLQQLVANRSKPRKPSPNPISLTLTSQYDHELSREYWRRLPGFVSAPLEEINAAYHQVSERRAPGCSATKTGSVRWSVPKVSATRCSSLGAFR